MLAAQVAIAQQTEALGECEGGDDDDGEGGELVDVKDIGDQVVYVKGSEGGVSRYGQLTY